MMCRTWWQRILNLRDRKDPRRPGRQPLRVEQLESRITPTGPLGLTPSQLRQAYGFNAIGDGTGQTIAIVVQYHDKSSNGDIFSDLNSFDSAFGLPAPPTFTVFNQSKTQLGDLVHGFNDPNQNDYPPAVPAPDNVWAREIPLDVEWAHAMAPGASIDLVEANVDNSSLTNFSNLINYAVNNARTLPGVSVVSMSFGRPESVVTNEASYDQYFTTPSGHNPITFVACSGDMPPNQGETGWYPAFSPNVLAVGGTSLNISVGNGNYGGESVWNSAGVSGSQSGGGTSTVEMVNSTFRTIPDVVFDGDPNSGVPVYSSFISGGWGPTPLGGTSLGAPCWAALIAIADQARVAAGSQTLDGVQDTRAILYGAARSHFNTNIGGYTSLTGTITSVSATPNGPGQTVTINYQAANSFTNNQQLTMSGINPTDFDVTSAIANATYNPTVTTGSFTYQISSGASLGSFTNAKALNQYHAQQTYNLASGLGSPIANLIVGDLAPSLVSSPLQVSSVVATPTGFKVSFNKPFQPTDLALYGAVNTIQISTATDSSNTATITTSSAHHFSVAQSVMINNCSVAGYDGTVTILSVPTSTTFTYARTGLGSAYGGGAIPAPDVTLFGATSGLIMGSVIIDPSYKSITFNATINSLELINSNYTLPVFGAPILPDDTYTVTLVAGSGSNGFFDLFSSLPLGWSNGAGHSYSSQFTVTNNTKLTSSTNNTVGTGTRTFSVSSGLTIPNGYWVRMDGGNGNTMSGSVTSYSGATLTVNSATYTGSGASSSWTITVSEPVLGIPDFARGPDSNSTIKVPNDSASGIPITLYNAANATSVTFTLYYNPSLLTITGASTGDSTDRTYSTFVLSGAPVITDATHATANFHYTDTGNATPPAGTVVLGDILAYVPNNAASNYRAKELLQLSAITINQGTAALSSNGIHVNAYFGDVSGSQTGDVSGNQSGQLLITSSDVTLAHNVATGAATGFAAFPLVDPVIVGDVALDYSVDAGDESDIAAYINHVLGTNVIPTPPWGNDALTLTIISNWS